jgi:hypothetical protein
MQINKGKNETGRGCRGERGTCSREGDDEEDGLKVRLEMIMKEKA